MGPVKVAPSPPFLFAIIIEPLAASIRQSPLISPINVSIPPLLGLITKFGNLSGFSINLEKSELMPVSAAVNKDYLQSIPFKKSYKDLTYLGMTVTKNPNELLRANWQSKIEQLKTNIKFWKTLPISMAGKMNAIKMIVLPRFLHLFQSIPCFIALSYFKQLD